MFTHSNKKTKNGFTLVELAVVLIIIGLVLIGVLVGQTLINSSRVSRVSTQVYDTKTAMTIFKDKYGGWPGDLVAPNRFWGPTVLDAHCTSDNPNSKGNNTLETLERNCFWPELAVASLIKGSYSTGTGVLIPGENILEGPFQNSGYLPAATFLTFGQYTASDFYYRSGVLVPGDAETIDIKMDDSKPSSGLVRGLNSNFPAFVAGQRCLSGSAYNVVTGEKSCYMTFYIFR